LSGPALKPVQLRQVYEIAEAVEVPIIGCGGISTAQDALDYLLSGATAIQVGTATFVNPLAPLEVLDGLERYCCEQGVGQICELVGSGRSGDRGSK
jgi:dihydroorotate dehydrogenase (NAD+) catalytic subunit